ncbi:MAG TPA: hypothetical protein DEQ80_01730 [Anaerolinea thermolimosa]|uniref:Uncharacterized protein n=1 Tax=Anaerolinea thermolimosa TaxID=229919 RepID=A0A3D1JE86_9CHLR|nr:hypothetical protein [Anaerolinea thermolimosa]GAP07210.1 hypothetical protein ATHL_02078 [Anaerolinea thermolimosa]HCE16557.1 hypothetical protein [Anaerolinea thermolimosa]
MPASAAPSTSLLLIIALVCITIGYVFGWLISSLQHSRDEKRTSEDRPADELARAIPVEKPAEAPSSLLRLSQKPESNDLLIEVRGKTFSRVEDLTLEDRAEVESALRRTAQWMGWTYSLRETVTGAVPVVPKEPPAEPVRPPSVVAGMTNALADVLQPTAKVETPKSIVEQIDAIFQSMLVGTPYENQKIYIAEDTRHGVIVRIGNDLYEGVGAVPEGEIKALLRSAVSEWERQQEQNRRRVNNKTLP